MSLKVTDMRAGVLAEYTFKWLVSGVCSSHVFLEVGDVDERLVALGALVRFAVRVYLHVFDEVAAFRERFVALVALVRAYAGVDAHVLGEATGLGEGFAAFEAFVWVLDAVDGHVSCEGAAMDAGVRALCTLECFFVGMSALLLNRTCNNEIHFINIIII